MMYLNLENYERIKGYYKCNDFVKISKLIYPIGCTIVDLILKNSFW